MSKEPRGGIGFWAMINNVLIHAINKGQLPGACITLVLIVLSLRYPSDQIPTLFQHILQSLKSLAGVSYALNVVLLAGSAFGFRALRRRMSAELDRVGREKTALQQELAGRILSSSIRKNKS